MPPSSAVRTFTDPDEYAASIRGPTASEITITGRGHFTAKLVRVDMHRLSMRRFSDNLPRTAHSVDSPGHAHIVFRTHPGPSLRRSGVEMHQSNIIRRGHAESYFQHSEGGASWGSISLTVTDMASVGAALAGCDLTPPKDALSVTPPPAAMARLQHLHAAAGTLAEDAPAVIAHPEAARGLEQALVEAMIGCLGAGEVGEERSALRQHAKIMRRFHRAVEEQPDQALFLPELCTAIGVSERTLRMCCQEQLGVSPKRFLILRRMHLVRRDLRECAPTATTVTEIATRYGFWQFGRFAGEYKFLFGELPSVTLGRPNVQRRSDIR
jgi:AraC-like DNA-binding protein